MSTVKKENLIVIILILIIVSAVASAIPNICEITETIGAMNTTANMTAGPPGAPGSMNQTPNMTAGPPGSPGSGNDAWYPWLNGTKPYTGALNLNWFNITNVSSPIGAADVTTKAYEDARAVINNTYATLVNGRVPTVQLGFGLANNTAFLRGDQQWAVPPTGGSGGLGYTLYFSHLTTSPADNVKNFWGMNPLAPSTTGAVRKVPVPKTGAIKEVHVAQNSGTAGTAQAYDLYIYKNNVYDNSTGFVGRVSVSASIRLWDNTTMNLPVTKGDYLEMCFINPPWVTNPLTTISNGYVYIE